MLPRCRQENAIVAARKSTDYEGCHLHVLIDLRTWRNMLAKVSNYFFLSLSLSLVGVYGGSSSSFCCFFSGATRNKRLPFFEMFVGRRMHRRCFGFLAALYY